MEEKLFWESFKQGSKNNLPNLFTLMNLLLGMVALLYAFSGYYELSVSLIFIAMVMDGLDGKLAVKLNVCSDMGKQLDSLCDLVSFGVVPAAILYNLTLHEFGILGLILTLLFPAAGAFRLARFNVTVSSNPGFTGLPITIAGGALASLVFHVNLYSTWMAPLFIGLLSILMVSRIPYPAVKKGQNLNIFLFLLFYSAVICFIVFILAWKEMVFYVLATYVTFGLVSSVYRLLRRQEEPAISLSSGGEDIDC